MLLHVMEKKDVAAFAAKLLADYRVVGPVSDRGHIRFATLENAEGLVFEHGFIPLPPKGYLHPSRETIFRYETNGRASVDPVFEEQPTVILGVHPCDIHGINRLDNAFRGRGQVDDRYFNRRDNTILVGTDCTHDCVDAFCQDMGTDEVLSGYDLFFVPSGDVYLIRARTLEGQDILQRHGSVRPADESEQRSHRKHQTGKPAGQGYDPLDLALLLDTTLDSKVWDQYAEDCLGCANCTFACPTCFSYDMRDRSSLRLDRGTRDRGWDSCFRFGFVTVAGGHTFRSQLRDRIRFWYYHHFASFTEQTGAPLCVGCGRCSYNCPVRIRPPDVLESLRAGHQTKPLADRLKEPDSLVIPGERYYEL